MTPFLIFITGGGSGFIYKLNPHNGTGNKRQSPFCIKIAKEPHLNNNIKDEYNKLFELGNEEITLKVFFSLCNLTRHWPSENKPATNPNRSEIKKKTLPQLKKQPLAIDRYQLGKTIEDIVTAEKYFKRIQAYIIGHYPFENKLFK